MFERGKCLRGGVLVPCLHWLVYRIFCSWKGMNCRDGTSIVFDCPVVRSSLGVSALSSELGSAVGSSAVWWCYWHDRPVWFLRWYWSGLLVLMIPHLSWFQRGQTDTGDSHSDPKSFGEILWHFSCEDCEKKQSSSKSSIATDQAHNLDAFWSFDIGIVRIKYSLGWLCQIHNHRWKWWIPFFLLPW